MRDFTSAALHRMPITCFHSRLMDLCRRGEIWDVVDDFKETEFSRCSRAFAFKNSETDRMYRSCTSSSQKKVPEMSKRSGYKVLALPKELLQLTAAGWMKNINVFRRVTLDTSTTTQDRFCA